MQKEILSAWTDVTLHNCLRSWKSLLPLVPASLPEGITYYHRASKFMPVAAKENSKVSLNGFNG